MTWLIRFALVLALGYGALCALLFVLQRSFIYYPVPRTVNTPVLTLVHQGEQILVAHNGVASDRAALYFGGNAEDVSTAVAALTRIFPGTAVYAMHYRSYGGSTGQPTEAALVADALALFDQIAPANPHITLVGRSLGSGVAAQVAAARAPQRLVLVTPYDSIAALAAKQFPYVPVRWLLRDRFDSVERAGQLRVPTTLVIAGRDQVIPPAHSERLASAFAPGVANVVRLTNAGHNDVSSAPGYAEALAGLMQAGR